MSSAGLDRRPSRLFDRIAPVYDRSRGTLDDVTADALAVAFRRRGVGTLLEIGVGTGRIAAPLEERGLRVTGLDPSRAMMARARPKGVRRLVQGSAFRLPFRDGAFDGVLMAHVLHLLEDPATALRESVRVGRRPAAALVTLRDDRADDDGRPREDDLRRALQELLRARGVELPPFQPPWRKERELLQRFPPAEVVPISDRTIREPAERRIEGLELRAYRNLLDVPPPEFRAAIAELYRRFEGRTITARRIYALALWSRPPGS